MTVLCMVLIGALITADLCMTAHDEWTEIEENR